MHITESDPSRSALVYTCSFRQQSDEIARIVEEWSITKSSKITEETVVEGIMAHDRELSLKRSEIRKSKTCMQHDKRGRGPQRQKRGCSVQCSNTKQSLRKYKVGGSR